jgi:CBS domain-containing protein
MAERVASDIMTKPVHTVRPQATLEEAAQLFVTHHISGAPVVDTDGRLLGIVTEADLIDPEKRRAAIPRTALFGLFPIPDEALLSAFNGGRTLPVRDVMTGDVVTATEQTPVTEIAQMMLDNRINRVPIMRDYRVVGIITRTDLLRAFAKGEE